MQQQTPQLEQAKDGVPPWPQCTNDALLELMCGDADAVEMLRHISLWSHAYDDLIDRDKPIADDTIHDVMWRLLVKLPMNPFWRKHELLLRPLFITGILNWRAANDMQAAGCEEELRIAHVIRYSISDVGLMAMALAGGESHAMKNARRARLLFQFDTWEHYRGEHMKEPQ